MTQKEKYQFPLIDVVLYTKGHYKRTGSIWYDMALCLWRNGEGYGPFYGYSEYTKLTPQEECYRERAGICDIIRSRVRKLIINQPFREEQIVHHISPEESWKVGYYTKSSQIPIYNKTQDLPEWEYWEAVLRAHLSELCHMTCHELGYDNWDNFVCTIPELQKETPKIESEN